VDARTLAERVAALAAAVAEQLGWDEHAIDDLRAEALLHDVGRLSVAAAILAKPGPLTLRERSKVERHPTAGARIVAALPELERLRPCVLHQHERWDGRGYPTRLAGPSIPIEARLLALADAFDAMTSPRPYRDPIGTAAALAKLERCAGTQFEPVLAEACLEVWGVRVPRALPRLRASFASDGSLRP
jgi:HD-GYP domain-containing protein (c-di-GMP phosphodiesterase class II)